MSRIGKLPIPVPAGVSVTVDEHNMVVVKGPKGTLSQQVNPDIKVIQNDGELLLERPTDNKPHKDHLYLSIEGCASVMQYQIVAEPPKEEANPQDAHAFAICCDKS